VSTAKKEPDIDDEEIRSYIRTSTSQDIDEPNADHMTYPIIDAKSAEEILFFSMAGLAPRECTTWTGAPWSDPPPWRRRLEVSWLSLNFRPELYIPVDHDDTYDPMRTVFKRALDKIDRREATRLAKHEAASQEQLLQWASYGRTRAQKRARQTDKNDRAHGNKRART
jgi:hypothetical protein